MSFTLDPNTVPATGVYARIEDAGVLADAGRFEGALLLLLVAVAATARKRYPRGTLSRKRPKEKMGDREAFTLFLKDEMWRLVREHTDIVYFRGRKRPIEDFLYEFLRCELFDGRNGVTTFTRNKQRCFGQTVTGLKRFATKTA